MLHHCAAVPPRVLDDSLDRLLAGTLHHLDPDLLVRVGVLLQLLESLGRVEQCAAAAHYNAFLDGCLGGVECVSHAVFYLGNFDFGGAADLDHTYAAH